MDYYNGMDTLVGNSLERCIIILLKYFSYTEFPYTSSSTDVWDILKQTDKDPNDSNNVILFYTGWSVDLHKHLEYEIVEVGGVENIFKSKSRGFWIKRLKNRCSSSKTCRSSLSTH